MMKVLLLFPKCWFNDYQDSYWVEIKKERLHQELFLPNPNIRIEDASGNLIAAQKIYENNEDENIYFLISKDLKFISYMPFYYPYSGQWNGDNPLKEIEPVIIQHIEELLNLEPIIIP